jgi:hypothetical protein
MPISSFGKNVKFASFYKILHNPISLVTLENILEYLKTIFVGVTIGKNQHLQILSQFVAKYFATNFRIFRAVFARTEYGLSNFCEIAKKDIFIAMLS